MSKNTKSCLQTDLHNFHLESVFKFNASTIFWAAAWKALERKENIQTGVLRKILMDQNREK